MVNPFINTVTSWFLKKRIHQIELFLKYPNEVQNELLLKLLNTAKNTSIGKLYDFKETVTISPDEGARWHLIQALAGDNTDGYSGVPGVGIKKAEKIFSEKGYTWKAVVETFEEKDMTEEDALCNARLARILTTNDYDHEKKEPILWEPVRDYKINSPSGLGNDRDSVSSL